MRLLPRSRRGTWLLAGASFLFLVGLPVLVWANRRDETAEKFAQIRDNMTSDEISELIGCEPMIPIGDFVGGVCFRWETSDASVAIEFGETGIRSKSYDRKTLWWSLRNWMRKHGMP